MTPPEITEAEVRGHIAEIKKQMEAIPESIRKYPTRFNLFDDLQKELLIQHFILGDLVRERQRNESGVN